MKIRDFLNQFKNFIFRKKLPSGTQIQTNNGIASEEKIDELINNIPPNLSKIEKAYYIYLEIGKIVNENPKFVFGDMRVKEEHYNDEIDENNYGICKSISELYVRVLKDKRVGIDADLVKRHVDSKISHIDVILKIDDKNYIANLISDLSRIKTSRRVNSFAYDLAMGTGDISRDLDNREYLDRLEKKYGKISSLSRKERLELDKKLGYNFYITTNSEIGFYTEDTLDILARDMKDPEKVRKYLLKDENVPDDEILKRKIDFIFEHINELTEYKGEIKDLERIRYYHKIAQKVLLPEERLRIQSFAAIKNNDYSNLISILRINPPNGMDNGKSYYYVYSLEENKYVERKVEDMREYVKNLRKSDAEIIGIFDKRMPQTFEGLEI